MTNTCLEAFAGWTDLVKFPLLDQAMYQQFELNTWHRWLAITQANVCTQTVDLQAAVLHKQEIGLLLEVRQYTLTNAAVVMQSSLPEHAALLQHGVGSCGLSLAKWTGGWQEHLAIQVIFLVSCCSGLKASSSSLACWSCGRLCGACYLVWEAEL